MSIPTGLPIARLSISISIAQRFLFERCQVSGGASTALVSGWEWGTHNLARVDPEGKRIIYSKLDRGSPVATMIRDIETGKEEAFSLVLRNARWSPDGKFIVGTELRSGDWSQAVITLCSAYAGPCRALTKGYIPRWSSDGARIYFYKLSNLRDGEELWSISRDGRAEKKLFDLRPQHPIGHFFDVSPRGEVVWVQYRKGKSELWLSDFPDF